MYIDNYTHESGFFWQSSLSSDEKAEIIKFVQSLDPYQRQLIDKMLRDTRLEAQFDVTYDG